MNQTLSPARPFSQLQQATIVILLFQAVFLIGRLFDDGPNSNAMLAILVATIAFSAMNRRMSADPEGRRPNVYMIVWRYGLLLALGVLTAVAALDAYLPESMPDNLPFLLALLMPVVLALKGAVLGKLKPNPVFGLQFRWTRESRLAWEQAHRLMGRILFFGGLMGIVAAPFVPFLATFIGSGLLVATGVTAGAIRSRRVWLTDPERTVTAN